MRDRDSRERGGGTDAPGVISLIFGCIAVVCTLMGCLTCGTTFYVAVPFSLIGGLVGFFGRGNMRVAGLLLSFLALIPALIVTTVLGEIGSIAAVAQKNQGAPETQPSKHGPQMIKENELSKAKAINQQQPKTEQRKAEQEAKEEAEREMARRIEEERRAKAEAEARKVREKAEADKRAKEDEVSAASKLTFAKSLHSASPDAVGQESVRLEREYVNSLREIIKKYPMTKAAKEAKELLDKMGRSKAFLVPTLRLGTHYAKLRFASASHAIQGDVKRSFADDVPKQSLGTRKVEEGRGKPG